MALEFDNPKSLRAAIDSLKQIRSNTDKMIEALEGLAEHPRSMEQKLKALQGMVSLMKGIQGFGGGPDGDPRLN